MGSSDTTTIHPTLEMNPTFNPALDIKESAEVSLNACAKNEQPEEPVNNEYPLGPPVWGTYCVIA